MRTFGILRSALGQLHRNLHLLPYWTCFWWLSRYALPLSCPNVHQGEKGTTGAVDPCSSWLLLLLSALEQMALQSCKFQTLCTSPLKGTGTDCRKQMDSVWNSAIHFSMILTFSSPTKWHSRLCQSKDSAGQFRAVGKRTKTCGDVADPIKPTSANRIARTFWPWKPTKLRLKHCPNISKWSRLYVQTIPNSCFNSLQPLSGAKKLWKIAVFLSPLWCHLPNLWGDLSRIVVRVESMAFFLDPEKYVPFYYTI